MDLLTKTGPISGAVWARGMERLQPDAHGFRSLQAVRNKACVSSFAPLVRGLGVGERKKKKRLLMPSDSLLIASVCDLVAEGGRLSLGHMTKRKRGTTGHMIAA